jgi:hypothetical protein
MNEDLNDKVTADQIADDEFLNAMPSVIIPAHEDFYKLLAYAGPPPKERMTRGVTKFSKYVPYVRLVAKGLRTMYPDMKESDVYSFTIQFTDWCRQQRLQRQ